MRVRGRLPYSWGATEEERARVYPCDALLGAPDQALLRAVDIQAPVSTTFRWLCQLRVAPYSYDWLDNGGHQSPPRITPGLEQLARGQVFMTVFELVEFEAGRQVTLSMNRASAVALFGSTVATYLVDPVDPNRSRLLVKMAVRHPRRFPASLMRHLFAWGDLVMMRKQLLTLKAYAEAPAG